MQWLRPIWYKFASLGTGAGVDDVMGGRSGAEKKKHSASVSIFGVLEPYSFVESRHGILADVHTMTTPVRNLE